MPRPRLAIVVSAGILLGSFAAATAQVGREEFRSPKIRGQFAAGDGEDAERPAATVP
jgi:hypothetical protein